MPLFRRTSEHKPRSDHQQHQNSASPKLQPQLMVGPDDSDYSLYQAVSNTSNSDLSSNIQSRSRTSSVGQKFKSFFTPHSSSTNLQQDAVDATLAAQRGIQQQPQPQPFLAHSTSQTHLALSTAQAGRRRSQTQNDGSSATPSTSEKSHHLSIHVPSSSSKPSSKPSTRVTLKQPTSASSPPTPISSSPATKEKTGAVSLQNDNSNKNNQIPAVNIHSPPTLYAKSPNCEPISPSYSSNSPINSPNLQGQQAEKQMISNVELAESLNKLKIMPSVVENDLDEVLENSELLGDTIPYTPSDKDIQRYQAIHLPHMHPTASNSSTLQPLSPTSTASPTIPQTSLPLGDNSMIGLSGSGQQQIKKSGGPASTSSKGLNRSSSISSSSNQSVNPSSSTTQLHRGRSGKLMSKFLGGSGDKIQQSHPQQQLLSQAEDSVSPPMSRSTSTSSRQRSSSISMANMDPFQHTSSFYSALKHTQSTNVVSSTTQLNSNAAHKEHLLKLKNGRLKMAPDGSSHEHDYLKYRTQPIKSTKGWFSWAKKKDEEDDSHVTIEQSISLLPDSYSQQLMELKSDPKNYRWNYDDSDEDNGSDGNDEDSDDDEDDNDFDDDADDELIEPIIGKDQLNLINVMMDKIEHPEKFKERLEKGSRKMKLTAKYGHIEGVVGRGSYGTVSISVRTDPIDKKRKSLFAIKQLKQKPSETLHHFGNRVTSEFMISSCLTHQAIINVYDLMVDPVSLTYSQVMEFIPCGDLFSLISVTSGLEVIECDCFFKQTLNAITYLHSVGISHNDLKVENLLLTRKGQLKIIDFGTSAVFKTSWEDRVQYSKGACGSERYVSPEQFSSEKEYDPRLADIWSLGIIYLVMMYGNYVWESAKESDDNYEHFLATRATYNYKERSSTTPKQFKLIKKGAFNHIESINQGSFPNSRRYVLYNILNPDPKYRMRSYQIWQSDWIKSINVCDAGRGMLSHEDYVDMAYSSFQAAQAANANGAYSPPQQPASGDEVADDTPHRARSASRSAGRSPVRTKSPAGLFLHRARSPLR